LPGLFAVSIVFAACSSDDGATGTKSETGSTAGETTITIEGSVFDPNTITVSGPTEVTITINDSTTHTFTLDDGSVSDANRRRRDGDRHRGHLGDDRVGATSTRR